MPKLSKRKKAKTRSLMYNLFLNLEITVPVKPVINAAQMMKSIKRVKLFSSLKTSFVLK